MRRIGTWLAALAGAGALVWAAAPALSLEPYAPEPVEFEQPVPAVKRVAQAARRASASRAHGEHGEGRGAEHGEGSHARHGELPVRFRSAPIEAPKRFDAVGIAGELRPMELRYRDGDGEWSPWLESVDGTPIWSGGADELQLRSRGPRPNGTLHYVNVSGTATPADGALNAFRGAVNSAFIAATSLASAEADVPKPKIRGRRRWDPKRRCKPRTSPAKGRVKAAAVHHTVNSNGYRRSEVKQMLLAICLFHRNGNGWNDIGYNAIADRFGRVWHARRGRIGKPIVGAHTQGYNSQTTGLALLGDHSKRRPSKRARKAAGRFLAWKLDHHNKPARGRTRLVSGGGSVNRYPSGERVRVARIFGHGKLNATACPGRRLRRQLRKIRRHAERRIERYSGDEEPPDGGVG